LLLQSRLFSRSATSKLLDSLGLTFLLLGRWKPTLVLDQAPHVFDLTGVARVAVDNAGEPNA
jgi:hypothetical protein